MSVLSFQLGVSVEMGPKLLRIFEVGFARFVLRQPRLNVIASFGTLLEKLEEKCFDHRTRCVAVAVLATARGMKYLHILVFAGRALKLFYYELNKPCFGCASSAGDPDVKAVVFLRGMLLAYMLKLACIHSDVSNPAVFLNGWVHLVDFRNLSIINSFERPQNLKLTGDVIGL